MIATLIHHPEFCYYSEELKPNHFTDPDNRLIYQAFRFMADRGVTHVDPFIILEVLKSSDATRRLAEELTVEKLDDLIDMSDTICRNSVEEYRVCVKNVMDAAFRRDTLRRLRSCEALCFDMRQEDIERRIYSVIDDVMSEYSYANEVPLYGEVVELCWEEIRSRQGNGYAGIPFKFPTLNAYATIEKGELFIFAAEAKQGKSMMLLNCAVDLLKNGYSVLYIDSELNTRLFTARVLSHLTGIEYKRLTAGNYDAAEEAKIKLALEWLKEQKFCHVYLPIFDPQTVYTTVKKIHHTINGDHGLDVLIIDYFKSSGETEAFAAYAELGKFTDLVKNRICGEMGICGLGAAQANAAGRVADSARIGRNASTIAVITDKTPEEAEIDGPECGNKKLRVVLNRNGMQMAPGEYIDLTFDGNRVSYEEARQHIPQEPF